MAEEEIDYKFNQAFDALEFEDSESIMKNTRSAKGFGKIFQINTTSKIKCLHLFTIGDNFRDAFYIVAFVAELIHVFNRFSYFIFNNILHLGFIYVLIIKN